MKNRFDLKKLFPIAFLIFAFALMMMISASAETVASGSFATDTHPDSTWTWVMDSDGTLTIGGTGSNGNTTLAFGADQGRWRCPWQQTGMISNIPITKVIILEETGIETLGKTSLSYLHYCEEIVFPTTLKNINADKSLAFNEALKTVSVQGRDDAGEGIYDFRNIVNLPYGTMINLATASNVPEGIEVWLGENTKISKDQYGWVWFTGFGDGTEPDPEMTTKVTFRVPYNYQYEAEIRAMIEQQNTYDASAATPDTSRIDRTLPLNIDIKVDIGTVASGTFAGGYADSTWTWEMKSDGVLTIGGKGSNGNTTLYFGANNSRYNCPWTQEGIIGGVPITKVIILEETGIETLGKTSLSYLHYCEEIVFPTTLKNINASQSLCYNESLKTISVHGKTDAGEGIYDFRNIINLPYGTMSDIATASKVPDGIEIWLGEDTVISKSGDNWYWFTGFGAEAEPNPEMTTKVTFKIPYGYKYESELRAMIERQKTYYSSSDASGIDRSLPLNIELKVDIGTVASGTFAGGYADSTWTWEMKSDGVLTIGGKGSNGNTTLYFGANNSRYNCPWTQEGIIGGVPITKVIILEETGIETLGNTSLSYLHYCEEIVIPSTLKNINASNALCYNESLKTISVQGRDDAGEGIYDFRNIVNLPYGTMHSIATASKVPDGVEVWLGESTNIGQNNETNWMYFTGSASGSEMTTKVTFKVHKGSLADERVKAKIAQQASDSVDTTMPLNIEIKYYSPDVQTDTYANYSWKLDLETGTLTFIRTNEGWSELFFHNGGFMSWLANWKDDIKHIVVPEFSQYSNSRSLYPFAALPNLETVKWDTLIIADGGSTVDDSGMFYGCEKLTTFGSSENFKLGTVDLTGFTFRNLNEDNSLKNMFSGCISVSKVIFGNNSFFKTEDSSNVSIPSSVGVSMFENCTAIVSVDLGGIEKIYDSAFKNCSALTGDVYYNGDVDVGNAFAGCDGVIIRTNKAANAVAIANSMFTSGVTIDEAMVAGIIHDGFGVRIDKYNGLRSFYTFAGKDVLKAAGYTLVEYGSICGTADNYIQYTKDFGNANSILYLDGAEFKTANSTIVKTPIYTAEGYKGEPGKCTVNEDGSVTYTVTIINFPEKHYQSDVVLNGYEIWKDSEGNYKVIYSEPQNENYKITSLYDVTMAMLVEGIIEIGEDNGPVYTMLNGVEKTAIDVGNSDVEAFLVDHHTEEGKKIAIYRTKSETAIELDTLGLNEEQLGTVADFIFDGKVSSEVLNIDEYWAEHINAQLATIPEGKSFIAITDTHYESADRGNVGKSAALMDYVRTLTGIKKVINLGDPFHQENTYEGALEQLSRSMETKFYDYFESDGLYAIGNHDSNITIARNSGGLQMDLVLSDKDIYDRTLSHLMEGEQKKNIVFDEELIGRIEANRKDITEFVLDNVSSENKVSGTYFGNVSYTADQMYENLLHWAKLHYAYYDHESKICYIMLNTGANTPTDLVTLGCEMWFFHPAQYEFLETVLEQVAESYSDYDIVVAGHLLCEAEIPESGKDLFSMLSAFERGGSVSFTASGNNVLSAKLFGCTNGAKSRTLSYDFSGTDFKGEIISLAGHWHFDNSLVFQTKDGEYQSNVKYDSVSDELGDDAVLCILLNQDNAREKAQSYETNVQQPVIGTITEQCFSIFTITNDNTLVVTRIGANSGWQQKTFELG